MRTTSLARSIADFPIDRFVPRMIASADTFSALANREVVMDVRAIIGWIVFGFVIGVIARFIMPGRQSMGLIMTTLLGIAGSFVGGWLGSLIRGGPVDISQPAQWIGSIIGALILLFGYSMLQKKGV
jgi:uncharacterized membrane protein YeaQ/YmgE (transglycosylase-associated protein family)